MKQFRTALEFDSKEYEAWCQIVNDVYIGQDDPDLMISHIEDFVYRFEALVMQKIAEEIINSLTTYASYAAEHPSIRENEWQKLTGYGTLKKAIEKIENLYLRK